MQIRSARSGRGETPPSADPDNSLSSRIEHSKKTSMLTKYQLVVTRIEISTSRLFRTLAQIKNKRTFVGLEAIKQRARAGPRTHRIRSVFVSLACRQAWVRLEHILRKPATLGKIRAFVLLQFSDVRPALSPNMLLKGDFLKKKKSAEVVGACSVSPTAASRIGRNVFSLQEKNELLKRKIEATEGVAFAFAMEVSALVKERQKAKQGMSPIFSFKTSKSSAKFVLPF